MIAVEPIRDAKKFRDIKETLKLGNERNYVMFMLGTYSGLRISDLLLLQVKDVKDKEFITLREKKTDKPQKIIISKQLKDFLKGYCMFKEPNEYLIKSNQGSNKPISRVRAWQIMKEIGQRFDIEGLGTHTLRKTFGYHYYKKTNDISLLMIMYNHAKPEITLKYIGITQERINNARETFDI